MKLSSFTQSRENNYNLIRIIAALAVLVTHSFALALGSGEAEPFRDSLGKTMGSIAVDIFFITSGFLVTASLLTRKSFIEFVLARALRILPALIFMLILTVFGIGIFFTTLPTTDYLSDSTIYLYFLKCTTLFMGAAYNLPGVFSDNPYQNAVNGSLWSMPYELRMYAILAITWAALRIAKSFRLKALKMAIVVSAISAGILVIVLHYHFPAERQFASLFFMFFSGAAFYVLRDRISLSRSVFILFSIALITTAATDKDAFFLIYTLTISYILFYLAYIPSGFIRRYNELGDYSYGVYIYAFPIQQSLVALNPGISVLTLIIFSAIVTLIFSVFSWHVIERRALGLKGRYVAHTRKVFASGLSAASARRL